MSIDAARGYLLSTGKNFWSQITEISNIYSLGETGILRGKFHFLFSYPSCGWRRIGNCIYCDDFPAYKFEYSLETSALLARFIMARPTSEDLFVDLTHAIGLVTCEKIESAPNDNNMAASASTIISKLQALPDPFWGPLKKVSAYYHRFDSDAFGWVSKGEFVYPEVAPHLRFPLTETTRWVLGTFIVPYNISGYTAAIPHLTNMYEIVTGLPAPLAVPAHTPAPTVSIDGIRGNIIDILAAGICRDTLVAHLAVLKKFDDSNTTNSGEIVNRIDGFMGLYNKCIDAADYSNPFVIGKYYKRACLPTAGENNIAKMFSEHVYGGAFAIPGFGPECTELMRLHLPSYNCDKLKDPKLLPRV